MAFFINGNSDDCHDGHFAHFNFQKTLYMNKYVCIYIYIHDIVVSAF